MGDKSKDSVVTHLVGGGLSGLFSDGIVHPVDTVRTRMMTVGSQYKNATDAFMKITRNEGVRSLYKGFSAVAVGTIPGHALYFFGYELSKTQLNKLFGIKQDNNVLVHLTSGLIADIFGSITWTPMDVIKQRLQVQRKAAESSAFKITGEKYTGSFDAVRQIIKQEGIRGLYRGLGAGVLTYGPYVSLYFAFYEQTKIFCANKLFGTQDVSKLPFYAYLLGAGVSSGLAALITTPLDVVKTRIQVQEKEFGANSQGKLKYRNAFHAMKVIVQEEGYKALFNGAKPRCLWISGGTALTMVAYEEIKKLLGNKLV